MMAKETANTQTQNSDLPSQPPQETPKSQATPTIKKLVLFGVPIFLVQVVLVYFIAVKFIVPATAAQPTDEGAETTGQEGEAVTEGELPIFVLKEMLINPAGTNGTRFLLTSIGFEVSSEEAKQELERREVQVRDMLNTILTSKSLWQLIDFKKREEIRAEIHEKTSEILKRGKLSRVYFSKFIIQ